MGRHKKVGRKPLPPKQRHKNQIESQQKWIKENTKIVNLRFNTETEKDLLNKLEEQENKAGYIKGLIRDDIKKDGE